MKKIPLRPTSLLELRNKSDDLIVYCVRQADRVYPILSMDEILDYLICSKPLTRTANNEHFHQSISSDEFCDLLSHSANKLINHSETIFHNFSNDLYENLKVIETNIKIDCNFTD